MNFLPASVDYAAILTIIAHNKLLIARQTSLQKYNNFDPLNNILGNENLHKK
jgi:hypothetical protein